MPNIKLKKEFYEKFRDDLLLVAKYIGNFTKPLDNNQLKDVWSFIEQALINQKKEIEKKIEGRMDKKRARELCDRFEEYCGKRSCPFCGTNPEKQRKIILSLLRKEK